VDHIIVLPEEVSQKIAAGEVIEGPYSVVRELLDNSLDAGATFVSVVINNGGKDYILVTDDGSGMSEEDARLSIMKHTTSKIRCAEDLDRVSTMGFRGEALSSICTVSDFTMVTGNDEDGHGTKVSSRFGKAAQPSPQAANRGTSITVKNLFGNLPARRKFLKSNRAETARIKEEIVKKALAFHERGVSFKTDDRVVYTLQPAASVIERIGDLFGGEVKGNLIETGTSAEGYSLKLLLSNRHRTLPNRAGQYFFINRRPVEDRSLYAAISNPTRAFFPAGRFPYAFVFIEIEPDLIDINVHPQKKEIRIKVMQKLFSSIGDLVRESLSGTSSLPPQIGRYQGEYEGTDRLVREQSSEGGRKEEGYIGFPVEAEHGFSESFVSAAEERPSALDSARLVFRGSLFKTYLLFEDQDGIIAIDQHAAHERVLYEKYKKEKGSSPVRKSLLIPITFTPPRTCYGAILDGLKAFGEAGIVIEPFGEESFAVVEIPGIIPDHREEETVSLLLEEFCTKSLRPAPEEISERFLKIAACRAAVKEGDDLSEAEALRLIDDLGKADVPYMCPHGRPAVVRRSKAYIEKLFGRR